MAKLLFCVDHIFQRGPDGIVYTTGGRFPYSKWQEYLEFFDQVTVVGRAGPAHHEVAKLTVSSGPGVTHVLVDASRGIRRLAGIGAQRQMLAKLVDEADAVIGRMHGELGNAACSLAERAGKPYLVELGACPWDSLWNHGSPLARFYAPLMTQRTRAILRKAKLAHYVTREFLQRRYPTNGQFVCASNVMLPEPEPDLMARRLERVRTMRDGDRPLVFGTIGSMLTRLKGIDLAISALAANRARLPRFEYRVLGEGDPAALKAGAEALGIGDRLRFDGVLPGGAAVAGWLDDVDIYLQPSYQEGLPRAMIEAMNRGALVVGSTVGGIPELLPAARLHPPGNARALGERIVALLGESDAMLETEAARNFETAQHYSYARSLEEKRRAYRALADWAANPGTAPQLPDAAPPLQAGPVRAAAGA